MTGKPTADIARFGQAGIDDILNGGLPRHRVYLVEGKPGTGKTTLAMQFLLEGRQQGETGLYITLSETKEELEASAVSHGWSLDGIEIYELAPPETLLDERQQQSLLYSSDLELGETTRLVFEVVDRVKPRRIVFDSLSEVRLLAQSSLRYRRQTLALKHYFSRQDATVLMLDDMTAEIDDRTVHSVAHGVIQLEELSPVYGSDRRRIRICKLRGQRYRGGFHDFTIRTGGVAAFPRLVAQEHHQEIERSDLSSGLAALDTLLGGGVARGTSLLVLGPAGAGKTLIAMCFAVAACARGERVVVYLFDEDVELLLTRTDLLGMRLRQYRAEGLLHIEQVDAAELSPGEFAHLLRHEVTRKKGSIVIIDSLNGYQASMPEEQFLILHMHELLSFLNRTGVLTILTVAQHGVLGDMKSPADLTYLSDSVLLLRYFEASGRVRRALSVIKKRSGGHEDTIREFRISARGVEVGEPLYGFQGVLRGIPEYRSDAGDERLMREDGE